MTIRLRRAQSRETPRIRLRGLTLAVFAAASGRVLAAESSPHTQSSPPAIAGGSQPDAGGSHPVGEPSLEPASGVSLRITPYAWLTGFDGSVNARGVESDLDLSFRDVLESTDSVVGLMGTLDMTAERFVAQLSGAYAEARQESSRSRAFGAGGLVVDAESEVEFSTAVMELLGGYRVVDRAFGDEQRFTTDLFGGLRHNALSLELAVEAEASVVLRDGETLVQGVRKTLDRDEDWFEPFVGARMSAELHEGWTVSLRGDVGGFGVDGSSFAWQTVAALGYEESFSGGSFGLLAGYRALGQDYSQGGFEWDVVTHGPVLGFTLRLEF